METNYKTTVIPTNLMLLLDNKLQSVLFNLIQLSNTLADSDGYFYRSNSDLQKAFGMSAHPTIAAIETLYRHGIISVKSIGFQKGKRRTNYYRINFDKFNQYDNLTLLEIYNLPSEKKISMLNYNSKDFKATYTNSENSSPVAEKEETLTTTHKDRENGSSGLKSALNATSKVITKIISRNYISETERTAKIRSNAAVLIGKMKQVRKWNEYQEKMTLYEDWLKRCCSTLTNGENLKKELYHSALHVMDEITFDDDVPREEPTKDEFGVNVLPFDVDDDFADCPLMESERLELGITENQKTKLYTYKGSSAPDKRMTIDECIELGCNVNLLFDETTKTYYR